MSKNSLSKKLFFGALLAVASQAIFVGYVHKGVNPAKPRSAAKDFNARNQMCKSHLFYTMTDKVGDRHLAVCERGNCETGRSFKIKLDKRALFEISNVVRYSRKTIPRTLISTVLSLGSRPSGYMLGPGTQARIVLTKSHDTIVGDLFKDQNVRFSNGSSVKASGEIWRECDALSQIVSTIHATNQEIKKVGPKNLSGAKYLERLESQLTQAKILADSWTGKTQL